MCLLKKSTKSFFAQTLSTMSCFTQKHPKFKLPANTQPKSHLFAKKIKTVHDFLSKNDCEKILSHIHELKLNYNLNKYFKKKNINSIIKFMKSDKKNTSSNINLILIKNIGKIFLNFNFNQNKIKKFLNKELIN